MQSQDHYLVLGIDRSASGAEIKTAYRRLAQRCHPDVCADPGGAARFIAVAEASRTLRRSETRLAYDYRPLSGDVGDEGEGIAPGIDPFDLWCALFLWPAWGWFRVH